MIRARLRSFNASREIRTLLVVSAAPGEGKTTIARHLASAGARMGSRVLLLEADLRHPTLARQFDIRLQIGLVDVLQRTATFNTATLSIGSQSAMGTESNAQALNVLPSGPIPPNPIELIESQAMSTLLAQARSTYDFVVIDAPELTAVSDALLLLSKVDGVVIVGRAGYSRRDAAKRAKQVLDTSRAPVVGVIANGAKPRSTLDASLTYTSTKNDELNDPVIADPLTSGAKA